MRTLRTSSSRARARSIRARTPERAVRAQCARRRGSTSRANVRPWRTGPARWWRRWACLRPARSEAPVQGPSRRPRIRLFGGALATRRLHGQHADRQRPRLALCHLRQGAAAVDSEPGLRNARHRFRRARARRRLCAERSGEPPRAPFQAARDFEGQTPRDLVNTTIATRYEGRRVALSTTTGVVNWKTRTRPTSTTRRSRPPPEQRRGGLPVHAGSAPGVGGGAPYALSRLSSQVAGWLFFFSSTTIRMPSTAWRRSCSRRPCRLRSIRRRRARRSTIAASASTVRAP